VYSKTTRAIVKIQDGCNMFCTYCVIPIARGRIRSVPKEHVLNEIKNLVKNNHSKEIVLTGIHIASYGLDTIDNYYLIDLVEDMAKIEGVERIHLGSLEPRIITPEFLERLIKLEKVNNHFHLSLQSGCNETLKRMNRKYTVEEFEQVVNLIRDKYNTNVNLTTDIIVGFPR
jgi:threonylcarbamoyladenosine tRNA methylthiotransferase MtaB